VLADQFSAVCYLVQSCQTRQNWQTSSNMSSHSEPSTIFLLREVEAVFMLAVVCD
jgi:hypothetical protein